MDRSSDGGVYDGVCNELRTRPKKFLVTGGAGFIGSATAARLLSVGQKVVVIDNFATGSRANITFLEKAAESAESFTFVEGDIRDLDACGRVMEGVDAAIHLAALGSVPRSIKDPLTSHQVNVDGFVNILRAAQESRVGRVVYASSSSVYGDHPKLPKLEEFVGQPLSPYALTKAINEQYASVFSRVYGLETVGLRYFNVFGPRQDPNGPYAAVIPKWISALLHGEPVRIFGDGETSRDFCFVQNAVQANILAACTTSGNAINQVYNVAVGQRTTLNSLYAGIVSRLETHKRLRSSKPPVYDDFRVGDVKHSLADITKARRLLGYEPSHVFEAGLDETVRHFGGQ
jgi:UDP-N-acetylglucosamine 4-epimerase